MTQRFRKPLKNRRSARKRKPKSKSPSLIQGKYPIESLLDLKKLRKIFEQFSLATGLAVGFVTYPTQEILIATGWKEICVKFHRASSETEKYCKSSNIYLTKQLESLKKYAIKRCENGLIDGATPVIISGEHVASLFVGQVFFRKPDIEYFKEQAKKYGYNQKEYLDALERVQVISKSQFRRSLSFLNEIAVMIGEMGLRNLQIKETAEGLKQDIMGQKKTEEALRLAQFTIDHFSEEAFWIGPDAKLYYVNDAACHMLGYSRKQLLKMAVYDIDPNFPKSVWPKHWRALKRRGSFVIESLHRRKDGQTFPVEININYLKYLGKEYNFAFARDISERKRAEDALRESEEKYRAVVESANDTILLADPKTGIILDVNKKAEEMFGRPVREIIGMHQASLHPKEEAEFYRDMFEAHARRGKSFALVAFVAHRDGRRIPVQISANLIELKGRKVLLGIFSDITELKDIEDRLRKDKSSLQKVVVDKTRDLTIALKKLEDARRLSDIGQLATMVAHELRNPLGVIKTAVYNITRKSRNPSIASHLANIEKKISESDQIIANLLSYSRIKAPFYEKVACPTILDEEIDNCKSRYKDVSIVVQKTCNCEKEDKVEVDKMHMGQLFANLLNNACQAFPRKKGRINIRLNYRENKNRFFMEFKDNGIGMNKKVLSRALEPFFTTRARGIGLGLTVCKQVVALHGGTINIKSNRNRGTTVSVAFPIKKK